MRFQLAIYAAMHQVKLKVPLDFGPINGSNFV
jgi:hypothetical protein